MERTIALLQDLLSRLGYLTEPFTARELDPPTLAALHRFQQLHALDPTPEPDDPTWERLLAADERGECIVMGQVVDAVGPIPRAVVRVRDRDLGDAEQWPLLGTQMTDEDGRFVIVHTMETVLPGDRLLKGRTATADLIFDLLEVPVRFDGFDLIRLPSDERVTDDEKALGLQARRLEEVRIVVHTTERRVVPGATEFERLLAAFQAVWPQVPPAALDDGRREADFVARELGEPQDRIDALVSSFRLQDGVFNGVVPAVILYGLARSAQRLVDVMRLALATSSQLKDAILQAIEQRIIPMPAEGEIERALGNIREMTAARALAAAPAAGGAPYADVLRMALPDEQQQVALLRAAAGRESDPPAMWKALRAHPAFADGRAIDRAQFALQLDALTRGHLPLMETLQQEHGITSMRGLLDLDADTLRDAVKRPGIGVPDGMPGDSDAARADAFVTGVVSQLHLAFPTETVTKVLGKLPIGLVGDDAVHAGTLATLALANSETMRAAGTAFDIRTTHIDSYLADHGDAVLADVAAAERPQVVSALKRTQRLFRVSTGADSVDWMMRKGYQSAFHIAEIPRQTFIQSASAALGEAQARMLHSRASAVGGATLMSHVQMHDAVFGVLPAALFAGEDRIEVSKAIRASVAKTMPTWHALFDEAALCACTHCRSIYSPAAYLVDVLNFLDHSTKNADGKSPLDVLLLRRPDLAGLELTCENTNTSMPYVDLVNEVLESLVVSLDKPTMVIPLFDTEGATAGELRAAPQHTNWAAYVTPALAGSPARLDRAVYPRSLPFDAPLSAMRAYVGQLGVSRVDLMTAFADGPLSNALAAERLGLSPASFEVIAGETLEGSVAVLGTSLDERYGWADTPPLLKLTDLGPYVWVLKRKLAAAGAVLTVGDDPSADAFDADVQAAVQAFQTNQALPVTGAVDAATWAALAAMGPPFVPGFLPHLPTFLAHAGLSYAELVQVLESRFVNPALATFDVVRKLKLPGAELLAFIEADFQQPVVAELTNALATAGVAEADFVTWAQAHLGGEAGARFRQTILIDGPPDAACKLDLLTLRHWDTSARTLSDTEWMKLDRFIRLWRVLGWPVDELDLALASLGAIDINDAVLRQLAQIGELARLLDLAVPQVVALWADPDPTRPQSLYGQRFLNRALLRLDPAFQPDWSGTVLAAATVGEHLSALQAGLRVNGGDLAALRLHLNLAADNSPLTLATLGTLLRWVTLARALQINVRDLMRMLNLSGLQPFGRPADEWAALALSHDVRRLQRLGISPAQLALFLGDATAPEPDAARSSLLAQLREGLLTMAVELDPSTETDGALTRRALTQLGVDPPLVDAVLSLLLGTDRNSSVLQAPAVPEPVIPLEWAERLVYAVSAQPQSPPLPQPPPRVSLSCVGALTDTELATITAFSTDAGYRAAVVRLHAAPRARLLSLATALEPLGVPSPSAGQLLVDTVFVSDLAKREGIVRSRLVVLLGAVLPKLRDRRAREWVTQTLAVVLPNAAARTLLLEGQRATGRPLLPASDLTLPLVADFIALGASAKLTAAELAAAEQAYELLERLRRMAEWLTLDADDLNVLARHVVEFRPSVGRLFGYGDWTAIAAYAGVRARGSQPAGALAALWQAETAALSTAALGRVLGWPEEMIAGLLDPSGLALAPADVQKPAQIERLIAAGELVAALGVSVPQAAAWARLPIGRESADEARRAVKARYDEPAWLEVAGTLSDALRDTRRSALVDFLLPRLGVPDTNALYGRLLIDVEMSPCMATSRIKQAISSVQLFVQRCLLNLEPAALPSAIDAQHWAWMQNYRVWEANRKVLLYPENWIEPELRDDKTPFFRELESDLLQNDVSTLNVERALEAYLNKLDAVAKLEIFAMHVQDDFEPDEKLRTVVHIFGRTANPPHANYYRRYIVTHNGTGLWTPWEAMPVDVQGTLVAPVVFNRRLYLFWATVRPKEQDSNEIGIAWSECRDGAWSPTCVTDVGQVQMLSFNDPKVLGLTIQGEQMPQGNIQRLEASVQGDQLRLNCITFREFFWRRPNTATMHEGGFDDLNEGKSEFNSAYTNSRLTFVLGGCRAKLVKDKADVNVEQAAGVVMRLRGGTLEARPLSSRSPSPAAVTGLGRLAQRSRIVEDTWIQRDGGYFVFDDEDRTFLAQLADARERVHAVLVDPDRAFPRRAATETSSGAASAATTQSRLSASLSRVEAAGHPWATASISLASSGLSLLSSESGAIVQANRSLPSLHDGAIKDAISAEFVDNRLAVGKSDLSVHFEPLFHPFVCSYIKALRQYGVSGVLTLGNQQLRLTPTFAGRYQPDRRVVPGPDPSSTVDFGETAKAGVYRSSAYSVYNWELFFHLPMLVADRLMQNQRFEDARQWLHYVFNPTDGKGGFWKVAPLQATPIQSIENWLKQLHAGDSDLQQQIAEWKDHPFEPHRIARMRLPAYKKFVVMKYIDNQIAWGDSLFERDTIESINAATQHYVMAAEMLGTHFERIPPRGEPKPMTFAEMRDKLDALSNVAAEFENAAPYLSGTTMAPSAQAVGLLGISRSLYFCLPPNDKLLAYWDRVADRLFKVRHCMNLAGVVRQLPLFEPPIDPALLVAARAQGLDLGRVLGELAAPLPHHRFRVTLQRALEACNDVKALGAALLSTLEKKDAEALALLRATQEVALRQTMRASRDQQVAEAQEQRKGIELARAAPVDRLQHFRGLMGLDAPVPTVGSAVPIVAYDPKPATEGGVFLIDEEQQDLIASHAARNLQGLVASAEMLSGIMHALPMITLTKKIGVVDLSTGIGGSNFGHLYSTIARGFADIASEYSYDASHAGKMGAYKRRHQDYAHQANLAAREIMHIDSQITAANIRVNVASLDRARLETEIEQAALVEHHFRSKYTSVELYGWMHGQITGLYFQSYQLAVALAKRAERCYRFERGLTSSSYVSAGGWDNLHKGLLAGETLQLQLRQLERAHQEQDRRELEITKHVSLRQLAPMALISLKETGRCEFELPELLYDMDYPGHYMRRIKSVSVSIPAVTGPYTSLNATLTMLSNETRRTDELRIGKYERDLENDDERFVTDFAAMQAIVTSTGQNDSGVFELNLNDERYLPFEGAGAAGRWRFEMDPDCNRFDRRMVSDVVLLIRYTARPAGQLLAQKAKEHWKKIISDTSSMPLARLFSMKHEFPSEWHRLRTVADANGDHGQTIAITSDRFPMLFGRRELNIGRIDLFGVPLSGKHPTKLPELRQPGDAVVEFANGAPLAALIHQQSVSVDVSVKTSEAESKWRLFTAAVDVATSLTLLDDLLLVFHYGVRPVPN